ncbi:LysR family transcriptional regulator [Aeromicrobium sp. A1-2]|uniref:LysR family transcriptional regulator n=1 Tax=Aeromicrobium sp. A1-2 TaxID=2107713 RepID=UPI000E52D351|nr:LysR family transcriptional regulator [Aeromicrobium sp. A1-2]AXT86392.1 LysR family transcriptional regulator [Aeromicrobium sp. A1-2]
MIDLGSLRSLIAVRDHGSIVAAAAALDFTPSAVSQQIKKLERKSHSPMLERVGRSVILTERGRLLAERGTVLLADLEQVENIAVGGAEELRGTFRIASFSTANRGIVAPLLARLRTTAPELDITVVETDPREAVTLVERGGTDLALVHDWNSLSLEIPSTVESHQLHVDHADVLLAWDHRLSLQDQVTPMDLIEERWITTPAGTICHEWLVHMFAMHGHRPDVRYFDGSYSTHAAMVEHGVAVALVPRLGREPLSPRVRAMTVVDPTPQRRVSSVWRVASRENPARQHVQHQLEELFPPTS